MCSRLIILLGLLVGLFVSCERDDICDEGQIVTPRLILTFQDAQNPFDRKAVNNLLVNELLTDVVVFPTASVDSIAIPLRLDDNETIFRFIKDNNAATPSINVVAFTYDIDQLFINRACGFRGIYTNLVGSFTQTGSNWIQNIIVVEDRVENENFIHVQVLH
ncbi:MAG: DUF6452 family protein [Flavobacteriaceae bacterium]|nr:DUF6452 family protein [Flavobacteriaceae bacterium]